MLEKGGLYLCGPPHYVSFLFVFAPLSTVFTFLTVYHIQKDFLLLCKLSDNGLPPQVRAV